MISNQGTKFLFFFLFCCNPSNFYLPTRGNVALPYTSPNFGTKSLHRSVMDASTLISFTGTANTWTSALPYILQKCHVYIVSIIWQPGVDKNVTYRNRRIPQVRWSANLMTPPGQTQVVKYLWQRTGLFKPVHPNTVAIPLSDKLTEFMQNDIHCLAMQYIYYYYYVRFLYGTQRVADGSVQGIWVPNLQ